MASPASPDRRAPGQSPGLLSGGSCSGATRGGALGTLSMPAAPLCSPTACGRRSFPPAASPASSPRRRAASGEGWPHHGSGTPWPGQVLPHTCARGAGTLTQARDHSRCGAAVWHFIFWATAVQGGLGWPLLGPTTRTLPMARGHTSGDTGREHCGWLLAERLQLCSLLGWLAEKAQISGLSEEPVEKAEAQARNSAGTLVSLAVSHLDL